MPLYEYVCLECNERYEELRPASKADTVIPCTTCGSARVKRLLSVFAAPRGAAVEVGSSTGGCACGGHCSCHN
ncbi:MAG: zinc ribbon domain-containing protein [Chloroflexi bacterium]|nr:zinc ribbon domain-containing protein [Chloroflexota bacterium]